MARRKEAERAPAAEPVGKGDRDGQEKRDVVRAASSAPEPEQEEVVDPLDAARFGLRFSVLEQVAYHAIREQFLSRIWKLLTALQVLLGTSAVAVLADALPQWIAAANSQTLGMAVVLLSAVAGVILLVMDPAGGAREHRILRGRFHELLADCEERECDAAELRAMRAKKERIMAAAPPAYRAAQALAYNTAVNATHPEDQAAGHRYVVPWFRRWLANLWPMRGVRFRKEQA